jgi:NAD(P)-dependent dehydrogenase (short-subunit alcohol dehydrogenase family)
MEIKGKVILITGGARRVGQTVAMALAERGARLAIHYNQSRKEAEYLVQKMNNIHPGQAHAFGADLKDVRQIKRMVNEVGMRFQRIDVLINNASIYRKNTFGTTSVNDWEDHLNANLRAPFFLCQEVTSWMKKNGGGLVINIADWAALRPYTDFIPYCVSKAGLLCLNSVLAKALAPKIRVNAILPGPVLLPQKSSEKFRDAVLKATPLKRLGSPKDISKAVLYLIESGDFITGAQIPVDGGRLIA